MERYPKSKAARFLAPMVMMLFLLTAMLSLSLAMAQEPTSDKANTANREPVSAQVPTDDGGAWEVGVHHSADPLEAHAQAEGWGLSWRLGQCNWNRRYRYNNTWAWEEDFKRSSLGGKENNYLDTVDLQFYVGHGWPGGFTFDNAAHDDSAVTPNDCYNSWGTNDNEWVALTSCQVLADTNLAPWARCMNGSHLIMGFKTNASAHSSPSATQGYKFARKLCQGYTVPQAWYRAADSSQPAGRVVRTLINELSCLNDNPSTGTVCADSYDSDAWVQTHVAGSEPPRYVDSSGITQMPLYQSPPLSLEEATNNYNHLGDVFDVSVDIPLTRGIDDPLWTDVNNGRELEMDRNGGLYGYYDLNNLWTEEQVQLALTSRGQRISGDDARAIADQFLNENGLMPSDAQFYEVVGDTISGGDIVSGTLREMNDSLLGDEQTTVWQVIYSRVLTYTPPARIGGDPIEFSVIGPGAKQKVYVSATTAQRGALGGGAESILGAMGGWRETNAGVRNSEEIETVEILSEAQIFMLHDQLEDLVVLNAPPIEASDREILTHTLAYWEHGAGTSQAQLIPAYALLVRYSEAGEQLGEDYTYIPANSQYMRPFARIASAPTEQVQVGQVVQLSATEAATPLSELGYDASLDFVLGSGTADDYIYTWYVDSVEEENIIGTGKNIDYTVRGDAIGRSSSPRQNIILEVKDITNSDQPSTTALVSLELFNRIFLPISTR